MRGRAFEARPLGGVAGAELPRVLQGQATGLDLPDHWCKQVFLAHTYLELQQNEQAVKIYDGLSAAGLGESTYIMAQV